jgi:class 3 adenylate cyclase
VGDREVRKLVTVLFCDLVGFTSTSEGRDPEAVRREQRRYFDGSREALERHGGTVEKFIGDAVMAVFGVPRAHEDDAARALRAALELRDVIQGLGLRARIGVASGEVVATTGTGDALVTGDAVNLASRLEHVAPAGEIWIDETTERLARGIARTEPVGPVDLKGKADPVDVSRLVGVGGAVSQVAIPTLVGRSAELATLEALAARSRDERRCVVATVTGPAGIGKSRLSTALASSVGDGASVWTGRCPSYGEGLTYRPLREIFRQAGDADELERAIELWIGGAHGPGRADASRDPGARQARGPDPRGSSLGRAHAPRTPRGSRRPQSRRPAHAAVPGAARAVRGAPGVDGWRRRRYDPRARRAPRRGE